MLFRSVGYVGIGSSSPAYLLDVVGRISYNGTIGEGADATLSSAGTVLLHGNSSTWTEQRFYTSGTQRLTINTSGNVGIGTTSPAAKLHVTGSASVPAGIFYGNVGIGTSSPVAKLDVKGDGLSVTGWSNNNSGTAGGVEIGWDGTEGVVQVYDRVGAAYKPLWLSSNSTMFYISGTERARFDTNGNLGIGTSSPNSKLTVGSTFASIVGVTIDTANSTDSALVARRAGSKPAFGILPWDSEVFLSSGTYYDGDTWVQHSNTNYNQLIVMAPATGISWYASDNGTASWNLASNITLWDTVGRWKSSVQSTKAENSYFTGGNLGVGTSSPAAKLEVSGSVLDYTTFNRRTSNYTMSLTDASKLIEMNVSTANTVNVPTNAQVAFKVGTKVDVVQYGAGQTTITGSGGSGVQIRTANGWAKINARYGVASLVKVATNEWYMFGNLSP